MSDGMYLLVEPFHVAEVLGFHLKQELNSHVLCELQLLLDSENGSKDRDSAQENTVITVSAADGEKLFQGILLSVQFTEGLDGIVARLTAASETFRMDEKIVCRSFQDKDKTIQALAEQIMEDYDKADMIYSAEKNPAAGQLLMQYQESNWRFLARIASHLHTWLIAEAVSDGIRFYFGCPKKNKLVMDERELKRSYSINSEPGLIKMWAANEEKGAPEFAVPEYRFEVDANRRFSIGDRFDFEEKEMIVKEVSSFLKESVLSHQLTCVEEKGFYCPKYYNPLLSGWNVRAKVKKAEEDRVEVHFYEIDEKEPENYCQFTYLTMYSAEGSGGWYFMPEEGDTVFIKFPTKDEKDAVADGSIRVGEERENEVLNPKIKRIRTKDGQEIRLTEDEIRISTKEKDLFICISEKNGIHISSHKDINITTEKELTVNAKSKVEICGKQELKLKGKSSEITMGATMDIKGNVKIN